MLKSPAVLVSNASLRYQDKVLFNRLNFHLAAGQTTCLLGSSGIGTIDRRIKHPIGAYHHLRSKRLARSISLHVTN